MVKTTRIELRVNPDDKELIKKAAELNGLSLSAYIISKILSSAKKDMEQRESIILDNNDRDFFYNLIENPPSPNKALQKLMGSSSI
ncbi:MAG: DUF1778 domain-containing protein [Spirochaetales bacterium]|nr:DUF1778 domain-containing protein [Spirochaetales bacterium]